MEKWRVITAQEHSAAVNMAMDEAILNSYVHGHTPPTIRFYTWKPAAISLGYFQNALSEIDLDGCALGGVDIVRRLTGGRAVLHDQELTYSIIVGEEYHNMPKTVTASYAHLTRGLLTALQNVGVQAEMAIPLQAYGNGAVKRKTSAACFDAPAHYELTVDRRKLVGSAQVRRNGVILQHGSLLLDFDANKTLSVLKKKSSTLLDVLKAKVVSLKQLQAPTDIALLQQELVKGFEENLEIATELGELSKSELEIMPELVQKYSSENWNLKR